MRSKLKILFPPLLLLLLAGCSSLEKKHFKAVKFFNEHENLAAEYCAGKFPSETEFIKGDEIVKTDTVYKKEKVFVDCPDGTKKECPEEKVIIETRYRTDTIQKTNTAYEKVLKNQIIELKGENIVLSKELKNARRYNWALGIALVICGILLIYRRR